MTVGPFDTWLEYSMLAFFIVIISFGLIFTCCILWRRQSHGFRGRILSHPWCSKCPQFRDWMQRMGNTFGLASLQLGVRDSLDNICDHNERQVAAHSQAVRQWRRTKGQVVGVRTSPVVIHRSATSGFMWKKKWRERKERSKQRRKLKHQERKMKKSAASIQGSQTEEKRGSIVLPSITGSRSPAGFSNSRRVSMLSPNIKGMFQGFSSVKRPDAKPTAVSRSPSSLSNTASVKGDVSRYSAAQDKVSIHGKSVDKDPPSIIVTPVVHNEQRADTPTLQSYSLQSQQSISGSIITKESPTDEPCNEFPTTSSTTEDMHGCAESKVCIVDQPLHSVLIGSVHGDDSRQGSYHSLNGEHGQP